MTYEEYIKKFFRGPVALTSYILVSVMAFMQFIAFFFGRWIDLVEFSSTVLLVVTMWMLYADAISKKGAVSSGRTVTCTFVWTILKLVSAGISILCIIIAGIYMIVKAGTDYGRDASLTAAGIILLLFGGCIYAVRLLVSIGAVRELMNIKNKKSGLYVPDNRWFICGIVLASLRGASLILQYVISLLAHRDLASIGWADYDWFDGMYGSGGSFMSRVLCHSVNVGSNVCITIIDMCYIAFFILAAIMIRQYIRTFAGKR